MDYRPNFLVPPLKVHLGSAGLAGQSYSGWNIATIESSDGLKEYALIWNDKEDKLDLWEKTYTNPEDPMEFRYDSGSIPKDVIKKIEKSFSGSDIWPIVEHCITLARKQQEDEGSTD